MNTTPTSIAKAATLTGRQVSEILGFAPNTITAMIRRGELEQVIIGGGPRGKRITRESVEAYIAARDETAAFVAKHTTRTTDSDVA